MAAAKPAIKGPYGYKNDEVRTPNDLLKELESEFGELYDPCPMVEGNNNRPCGLTASWADKAGDKWVFCNPPFSDTRAWVIKAHHEYTMNEVESILLVPARTWAVYWFDYVWPVADEIRFSRGAPRFPGYTHEAPWGIALIIFGYSGCTDKFTKMGKYEFVHHYA